MKTKRIIILLYIALPIIGIALLSHTHPSQVLGHTNLKQHSISQKALNYSMTPPIKYNTLTAYGSTHTHHVHNNKQLKPLHSKHSILKEHTSSNFQTQQAFADNIAYKTYHAQQKSTNMQNNTFNNTQEVSNNTEKTFYSQNMQFAPPSGNDLHNIPNPDVAMPLDHSIIYLSFFLILYSIKSYNKHN